MSTVKLILLALTLVQKMIHYAEKQGIIADEQRREILRQLKASAEAAEFRKRVQSDVEKMDEKAVDDALADDFRRP